MPDRRVFLPARAKYPALHVAACWPRRFVRERPAMDFLVSGRQGMSVRWLIKTPAAPGEWVDRHSGSPAREFHRRMRMPQALSYHPWMVREESGKSLEFNCSSGNIDWLRLAQIAAS